VLEKGRVPKRMTGQEAANMTRAVQEFIDKEEEVDVCRALLSSFFSSSLPSSSCCRAN